jgi:hypothetical protein
MVTCTPVQSSYSFPRMVLVGSEPVILGRTNGPTGMKPDNLLFTSRVVSRKHAEIYVKDEKVVAADPDVCEGCQKFQWNVPQRS